MKSGSGEPPRQPLFSIDLRALACLRIGMAAIVLVDIPLRLRHFAEHYTDAGVLPAAVVRQQASFGWKWLATGPAQVQALVFALLALSALALLLGYRTRLATIATWFFLCCIHQRNIYFLAGGDILLRFSLLWGALLPLGAVWSVDGRGLTRCGVVRSVASAGLQLQVALPYVINAVLKVGPAWLSKGTAIEGALGLEWVLYPWTQGLLAHPSLLTTGSRLIWGLELVAPVILLLPRVPIGVRLAAVSLLLGLQGVLAASFRLWPMHAMFALALVVFVPPQVFGRFRLGRARTDLAWRPSRRNQALASVILLLLLFVLARNLKPDLHARWIDRGVRAARMEQYWGMFAPEAPAVLRGYYEIVALNPRGAEAVVARSPCSTCPPGRQLRQLAPRQVRYLVKGHQWPAGRRGLAKYLCRTQPQAHGIAVDRKYDGETQRLLREQCGGGRGATDPE